jgi:cysteine synthase A
MVRLRHLPGNTSAEVWVKLESANPTGSLKDRIAKYMVEAAEARGELKPGSIIVEASTGNTGISFAWIGALKGYRTIIVMPEGMSQERKALIRLLGAELVLTPGSESDVDKALRKVEEILSQGDHYWSPGQFTNLDNVKAHRETTGPEILRQTGGRLDAFVMGVGSGGTITGVAQALKAADPKIEVVAVEPAECPTLSEGRRGSHRIEGIGDGFIPDILDLKLIDRVITVADEEAIQLARQLARVEGILGGISSGANLYAALKVAQELGPGRRVVTLIPDSGMRYLSTDLARL